MPATLPLEALLIYDEEESRKWQEFFRAHPQALQLKTDIAQGGSVHDLLVHIFAVEFLYTQRMSGEPQTPWQQVAERAAPDPFALGDEARQRFRQWLATADEADLNRTMTFGTLTAGQFSATRRKMFVHTMLHGVRHWAQLATLVRQNGYPDPGKHDFLFASALP